MLPQNTVVAAAEERHTGSASRRSQLNATEHTYRYLACQEFRLIRSHACVATVGLDGDVTGTDFARSIITTQHNKRQSVSVETGGKIHAKQVDKIISQTESKGRAIQSACVSVSYYVARTITWISLKWHLNWSGLELRSSCWSGDRDWTDLLN